MGDIPHVTGQLNPHTVTSEPSSHSWRARTPQLQSPETREPSPHTQSPALYSPHATTREKPESGNKEPTQGNKRPMAHNKDNTAKNKHVIFLIKKKKDFIGKQPKWWSRKTLNSPTLMSTPNSQLPVEQPSVKKTGNYPQRFSITKDVRASSLVAQTVKNLLPMQETRV